MRPSRRPASARSTPSTSRRPRCVLFDPLGYDGRFNWTLTYPDGTSTTRRRSTRRCSCTATTHYDSPLLPLGAGHLHACRSAPARTRPARRRCGIIDAGPGAGRSPGVPVSGTLAPVGCGQPSIGCTATAGRQVLFRARNRARRQRATGADRPEQQLRCSTRASTMRGAVHAGRHRHLRAARDRLTGDYSARRSPTRSTCSTTRRPAPIPIPPRGQHAGAGPAGAEPGGQRAGRARSSPARRSPSPGRTRTPATAAAAGAWTDRVVVRNVATGSVIAELALVDRRHGACRLGHRWPAPSR